MKKMKGHNIIRFFNLDVYLRENSVTETCTRLSNLNSITCNFKKLGLLVLFIAKKKSIILLFCLKNLIILETE